MFRFEHPWWLLGLIALLAVALGWRWLRRRGVTRFADPALLPWVQLPGSGRQGIVSPLLALWLGVALLVVALANPQWGTPKSGGQDTMAARVVVLLDLSRSMKVTDIPPDRLGAAKALVEALALELPPSTRIGLRVFDGQSHWVHGLTADRAVLRHFLALARADTLPSRGSRVELALDQTAEALKDKPGTLVVLLTDGHAPYWEPQPPTPNLKAYGKTLRLVTVGMGTASGGPVPKVHGDGEVYFRNEQAISRLQKALLQRLTAQLGGKYFDFDPALAPRLAKMGETPSPTTASQRDWQWHSLRIWPLAGALFCLALAFWPIRWRRSA